MRAAFVLVPPMCARPSPPSAAARLDRAARALREWQRRKNVPSDRIPTDTMLRSCPEAAELGLVSLLTRAGGYAAVSKALSLRPLPTLRRSARDVELANLATRLSEACAASGRAVPSPDQPDSFPSRDEVRRMDPTLANRLAAFPARTGFSALRAHVLGLPPPRRPLPPANNNQQQQQQRRPRRKPHFARLSHPPTLSESASETSAKSTRTLMTNVIHLRQLVHPLQTHPRILPKLSTLPSTLAAAIGRQGGARVFATRMKLVREVDYTAVTRYTLLAIALCRIAGLRPGATSRQKYEYLRILRSHAKQPPRLPSAAAVRQANLTAEITRIGGRRCIATRLGFARCDGFASVVLAPFSPLLAADVLAFAVDQVVPAVAGALAIPPVEYMRDMGRDDLAEGVEIFGGDVVVGRRLGLVPTSEKTDWWAVRDSMGVHDLGS